MLRKRIKKRFGKRSPHNQREVVGLHKKSVRNSLGSAYGTTDGIPRGAEAVINAGEEEVLMDEEPGHVSSFVGAQAKLNSAGNVDYPKF